MIEATAWRLGQLAPAAANLVPLYGVLVLGWPVFPVMALFWFDNAVVGATYALRILFSTLPPGTPAVAGRIGALFMAAFFCVHYGMFTAVHGAFVVGLFAASEGGGTFSGHLARLAGELASTPVVAAAALAIVGAHGLTLLAEVAGGERRNWNAGRLFTQPYRRVVVLHVTLLCGGLLVLSLGEPAAVLVLLVAVKAGVDAFLARRPQDAATA